MEHPGPLFVACDKAGANGIRDEICEVADGCSRIEDARCIVPSMEDGAATTTQCVDAAREVAEVVTHERG
jgi:hypothetical protein